MIVFFDGVCGLCNSSINWLIKRDIEKLLRYAPLQGETANEKLGNKDLSLDSMVVLNEGQTARGFLAIRLILNHIKHPLRVLLNCIPAPLGKLLYKLISKSRYPIFGKLDQCRLPNTEERELFLP